MSSIYERLELGIKIEEILAKNENCDRNNEEPNWDYVEQILYSVIEHDVPKAVAHELNVSIETKILSIEKGCLYAHVQILYPFIVSAASTTINDIATFGSFIGGVQIIKNIIHEILDHTLNKSPNKKFSIKEEVVKLIYHNPTKLKSNTGSCNFNKVNKDISVCANILEKNLINSGARIGTDFTKLDCFKLSLEIMKFCQTEELNNKL
jgi:hypothetical protein